MKRLLAGAALLLALGCDRLVEPQRPQVYAPWEEGLTLIYADPSRPEASKLQVRVNKTRETGLVKVVQETFTTTSGETQATFRLQDGLVALKLDGPNELLVFPEGFPDKVGRWGEHGIVNFVIGRSRVDLPGVKLPDPDVIGVWIESASTAGVRRRTLMVPDIGEVETLIWKDGRWVEVNRLVSRGFTDSPSIRSTP